MPACTSGVSGGLRAGLLALFCSLVSLTCHPVQAQSFGPPVRSEVILEFLDLQHNVKFTLAAYYTSWQNPFRTTITTVSPALGFQKVSRTVRIEGDTPASPLLEGTYTVSKQWRVGFWYNPIRGEKIRQMVQVVDVPVAVNLERDTDLMDLHVVYYGPRGLSAQLGYYRETGTIKTGARPGSRRKSMAWSAGTYGRRRRGRCDAAEGC